MRIYPSILNSKVSSVVVLITATIFFVITYFLFRSKETIAVKPQTSGIPCPDNMTQFRSRQFTYANPLLLTDVTESSSLESIRSSLSSLLEEAHKSGVIDQASVYFRRMNDGVWFSINPTTGYDADGLMKIIYLLVYLKSAESEPRILNSQLTFDLKPDHTYSLNKARHMELGKTYQVKQLLEWMIRDGDGEAEVILKKNLNRKIYNQLLADLEIKIQEENSVVSITDMTKFLRILYNGTYLNNDLSEYSLQLLSQNTFLKGLQQGMDPTLKFPHKYGIVQNEKKVELHEMGIVYVKDSPYLLGVMTKGSSLDSLSNLLARMAKVSFEEYSKLSQ